MDYLHGVRVIEINEGTRTIKTPSTAVIGIVCTANDADAEAYPLNTPVLLTNPLAGIAKAGTQGTLAKTLKAISNQVNTLTVVVRVEQAIAEEGDDSDGEKQKAADGKTTANIIGTVTESGQYTGLKALLVAQAKLGVKPRILGVPYLDNKEVATELAGIAKKLNAFAYVSAHNCYTKEQAVTYQKNFGQREVMVIHGDFAAFDVTRKRTETESAVANALGLRAYLDKSIGWHKTISNVVIEGVSGVTRDITFDIQDTSTDANYLNEHKITVPINFNGYRLWGSRTCSDDPLFQFENYTRTAQILRDTIADAHAWAIDKPMTPALIKDIIEGVNAKFRELKALGYIVDAKAWYDAEINDKDTLKAGKLYIDYDYTPVPPLENLNFRQRITDRYLADYAAKITA
ncbi:phage tail sheath protein [Avibacterium paragallinarum]|uniref:Phage tail protein n=1 Tax=Avibacterium paragallinarum TaxID=728 RepID=A0AAE5TM22_AVIPA|nr:phage tail sheath protein [Avibacterium paragallinarum]MEE3608172.1 phage tail sheath protein [Avibacterium paragallinarum]MEE3621272.1 phage tail sheath protein [Avibacterium paragallinarum]MEE3669301.1 phage tail sheath protein [Avibacterium paragallinarum]MEE3681427.1 phage tail sheath protein [Avibacterium paragallinarum]MEE4386737.1 phage tail sheath protein [Avibacterium paragallinarum]